MSAAARLRELLAGDEIVVAPGAYDALTARLVEQAGFPAVYMTGAGGGDARLPRLRAADDERDGRQPRPARRGGVRPGHRRRRPHRAHRRGRQLGFEEAIERVNRALQAGADLAFVEAPETGEQVAAIPGLVEGPCLINVIAAGMTPPLTMAEAADLGYRLAIVPVLMMAAVIAAADTALGELRETGGHPASVPAMPVADIFRRAGAEGWDAVRSPHDAG